MACTSDAWLRALESAPATYAAEIVATEFMVGAMWQLATDKFCWHLRRVTHPFSPLLDWEDMYGPVIPEEEGEGGEGLQPGGSGNWTPRPEKTAEEKEQEFWEKQRKIFEEKEDRRRRRLAGEDVEEEEEEVYKSIVDYAAVNVITKAPTQQGLDVRAKPYSRVCFVAGGEDDGAAGGGGERGDRGANKGQLPQAPPGQDLPRHPRPHHGLGAARHGRP
eukprot:8730985-Pyramimonas_sp.AAC.1